MSYLKCIDVSLSYDHKEVLNKINLEIKQGDFVFILGPNGGGKSSIVKLITKILKPTKGKIINNETNIGYLPQNMEIQKNFPASVTEVIYSGFKNKFFIKPHFQKAKIRELLALITLEEAKNKLVTELSGGQLQRVLFARALVNNPRLLILDEPTSALDLSFRKLLYKHLNYLNQKGVTVIVITHDLAGIDYVTCQNRVIYIDKQIKFDGSFCAYEQQILHKDHHHA